MEVSIKENKSSVLIQQQRSGESTNGYDDIKTPATYNINSNSSTPFLTDAPPDFYEEPNGIITLTSNSNSEEWDEANKRLLKSQYQQKSDKTLVEQQQQQQISQSGKEYRDMLRQGSYSSFSSESTISTKKSEFDHVGALLNRGKHPKQSSYRSDDTNNDNNNEDNKIDFDIYGNDENDDVSQSSTIREFDHVNSLLMRGSNVTNQFVRPYVDSDSDDDDSDNDDDEVAEASIVRDEFDLMALQPLHNENNNNKNDNSDDDDDSDDESDTAQELSRSDVKLERTPMFIQQKEEDMLSQKQGNEKEENELFIGETPKISNSSIVNNDSKITMTPPPPHDGDSVSVPINKPTFDNDHDDDDSSDDSNNENDKKSFNPSLEQELQVYDDVEATMADDDNDEKISFIPKDEPNKNKSKFELDDDDDSDSDKDEDYPRSLSIFSKDSSWKDEYSNREDKNNNDEDDNNNIKENKDENNDNTALLSADYQKSEQEEDDDNKKRQKLCASFKSSLSLTLGDDDDDNDIEKGEKEVKNEESFRANIDYNSDDEELGANNAYDIAERDVNNIEGKIHNNSKNVKILVGIVCLLLILSGVIVGIVLGTSSNNEEKNDPEQQPPSTMKPISILTGTSPNFTNIGNVISTNSNGKTLAMVGTTENTNTSLIHVYDAVMSEDKITSYEVTSIIDPTSAQILNVVLSGDGNYMLIATNEYIQVYTKSSDTTKWVTFGQQIQVETQSITNIPLSITYNGTIFAMSIPNINVIVYSYNNEEWIIRSTIQKPDNNGDGFGNSISLSSNDGNRIIIGADDSNTVFIYEYVNDKYIDIFINEPLFDLEDYDTKFGYSVSMNDNGNRIAIGSPYSNGYADNNLIESGRCNIYDIIGNENNYTWVPIGQQLYGEISNEKFGTITYLNDNGNKIAISSPGVNIVRVYELSNENWVQLGSNFQEEGNNNETKNNNYGDSISLSLDGSILFVGSPPVVSSDSSSNSSNNLYGETYAYDLSELASSDTSAS